MISGAKGTYTYNAQGLRTSKTVDGKTTNFTLVGGNVWKDGTYNYIWGAELITNGSVYYIYNAHGDVIQLLDESGNLIKTYDYDAYGNELTRDQNDKNPFRYCGEYYDTETGFIYLSARYYNPNTGRFISQDPAKDGLNWYAYCGNDPVNYIDSEGLKKELLSKRNDILSPSPSLYNETDSTVSTGESTPKSESVNKESIINNFIEAKSGSWRFALYDSRRKSTRGIFQDDALVIEVEYPHMIEEGSLAGFYSSELSVEAYALGGEWKLGDNTTVFIKALDAAAELYAGDTGAGIGAKCAVLSVGFTFEKNGFEITVTIDLIAIGGELTIDMLKGFSFGMADVVGFDISVKPI